MPEAGQARSWLQPASSAARYVVVSFFTAGTEYERLAAELTRSLAALDLAHDVRGVASRGSWRRNASLKAPHLQAAMAAADQPLLWADADSEFLCRPPEFDGAVAFDFAVPIMTAAERPESPRRARDLFFNSVLFFNNTSPAKRLLQRWSDECRRHPDVSDQLLLFEVWSQEKSTLRTCFLDPRYSWRPPEPRPVDAVLLHKQQSRRARFANPSPPSRRIAGIADALPGAVAGNAALAAKLGVRRMLLTLTGARGGCWLLDIASGGISAAPAQAPHDASIRLDGGEFIALLRGEIAAPATLEFEGDRDACDWAFRRFVGVDDLATDRAD